MRVSWEVSEGKGSIKHNGTVQQYVGAPAALEVVVHEEARNALVVIPLRQVTVIPEEEHYLEQVLGPRVGDPGYRSGGDARAKLHDADMAAVRVARYREAIVLPDDVCHGPPMGGRT